MEASQGDPEIFPVRMIRYQLPEDLFRLILAIRSLVKADHQQFGSFLVFVLLDKGPVFLFGLIQFLVLFQDLRQEDPSGLVLGDIFEEFPEKPLRALHILVPEPDVCEHDVGVSLSGIFLF